MKSTQIAAAILALISMVTAESTNTSTIIPNNIGSTFASASISINNATMEKSVSIKLKGGVITVALASVATTVYIVS